MHKHEARRQCELENENPTANTGYSHAVFMKSCQPLGTTGSEHAHTVLQIRKNGFLQWTSDDVVRPWSYVIRRISIVHVADFLAS